MRDLTNLNDLAAFHLEEFIHCVHFPPLNHKLGISFSFLEKIQESIVSVDNIYFVIKIVFGLLTLSRGLSEL